MARFFVGQRVRLVRPSNPDNYGCQGKIDAMGPFRAGENTHANWAALVDCDCVVLWDGERIPACAYYYQLEPILPEGMQPVSWS